MNARPWNTLADSSAARPACTSARLRCSTVATRGGVRSLPMIAATRSTSEAGGANAFRRRSSKGCTVVGIGSTSPRASGRRSTRSFIVSSDRNGWPPACVNSVSARRAASSSRTHSDSISEPTSGRDSGARSIGSGRCESTSQSSNSVFKVGRCSGRVAKPKRRPASARLDVSQRKASMLASSANCRSSMASAPRPALTASESRFSIASHSVACWPAEVAAKVAISGRMRASSWRVKASGATRCARITARSRRASTAYGACSSPGRPSAWATPAVPSR